jgi:hypothetical protein
VSERLVDDEGFPRADVDVHGVRISRNELASPYYCLSSLTIRIRSIACTDRCGCYVCLFILALQVDHQLLMKQIEAAMFAYHTQLKNSPAAAAASTTTTPTERKTLAAPTPAAATSSPTSTPTASAPVQPQQQREVSPASLPPFYLVDQVFENSPANVAGKAFFLPALYDMQLTST